jgi:hypothetical protein
MTKSEGRVMAVTRTKDREITAVSQYSSMTAFDETLITRWVMKHCRECGVSAPRWPTGCLTQAWFPKRLRVDCSICQHWEEPLVVFRVIHLVGGGGHELPVVGKRSMKSSSKPLHKTRCDRECEASQWGYDGQDLW